jgi:hypothetical protein
MLANFSSAGEGHLLEILNPVVHACRNSYTAVLKSLQAFDLITLGFSASVRSVSIVISKSSSSSPTERRVVGSAASGGGVIVALVFDFLDMWFLSGPCSLRLAFDLAMDVYWGKDGINLEFHSLEISKSTRR